MGFCKIPKALVKRYAWELKQNIDVIGKCLEKERLNQSKKCGNQAVSLKIRNFKFRN